MSYPRKVCGLFLFALIAACGASRSEDVASQCISAAQCESGEACREGQCVSQSGEVLATGRVKGAPGMVEIEAASACEPGEETLCSVPAGSKVVLRAPQIDGYRFSRWSGDKRCSGSEPTLMIAVAKDVRCVAEYVPVRRVAGIVEGGAEPVAASSEAKFSSCPSAQGACTVDEGAEVLLTAPRRDGFRITGWSGDSCDNQDGYSVTVQAADADVLCKASYETALTVRGRASGASAPIVASSTSEGAQCGSDLCAVTMGSTVSLAASDSAKGRFTGWTGDGACVGSEREIVISDVRTSVVCTANYVPRASVEGVATGIDEPPAIVASSSDAFAECDGAGCAVDEGGTVTLQAPSVRGYRLQGWSGAGCEHASGASVTIAPAMGKVTCTAKYVDGIAVIGTIVNAEGEVEATSSSPGADCGKGRCAIRHGGSVTLTAPTLDDHTFVNWSGDEGCKSTALSITLDDVQDSITCAANFAPRFVVTGKPSPESGGSVTASSSAPTARCTGPSCSVDQGATVTLTAAALGTRNRFTGWSGGGGCTGSNATLAVATVSSNQTCTANFAARVTVSVSADAGGTATVRASSAGATCSGSTCTIDAGTDVTVTASAAQGYRFSRWTGCIAVGAEIAAVPAIDTDTQCIASFERVYKVSGVKSPPEGGSLVVSVGLLGLPCLFDVCDAGAGDTVTIRATANQGYTFEGFSGCTANGSSATVSNPTRDTTCTARFKPMIYAVTVRSNDTTLGTASGPATAEHNGSITLTASPIGGNELTGWSCAGLPVGNTLLVSGITGPVSCTANFTKRYHIAVNPAATTGCATMTLSATNGTCDLFNTSCDVRAGGSVSFNYTGASSGCTFTTECGRHSKGGTAPAKDVYANIQQDDMCIYLTRVP